MKSDSTEKSEIKIIDKVKTSDKNNLKEDINQKTILQNDVTPEKNIKHGWHSLDIKEYPNYLKEILKKSDWIKQNTTINILIKDFENKFRLILQKKKIEFLDKGGNEIDFFFNPGYKKDFNDLLREYKNKKNQYFKDLSKKQKTNLARKKEIIEEIKKLIDKNQHDNNTYKNFKNLQDAFYNTGQVPRNENNNIWQTYKFHVERFYDLLHLNRELRDKDYSNNYEEKIKIIEKAEKLADLDNIQIAIRELNNLHRLWKNELGPVSRDKRKDLWERFQKATKQIHEKKNKFNKNIDSIKAKNYEAKIELINEIKTISKSNENSHNKWQVSIKKIEELKNRFIGIGNVPKEKNKELWNSFRDATRKFNQEKNNFYKNLKILEKKSIESKYKLINEVDNILMQDDWRNYAERIKEIQSEWKNTGRVSKKYSEKLWSEFKLKTNNFFEKFKNKNKILNNDEINLIREQERFLKNLKSEKIPLTPKKYESFIYDKSLAWDKIRNNDIGNQEKLVLKFLSDKWNEISIPKNKLVLKKYQTRLYFIKNNEKLINNEHNSLRKKTEEIRGELNQLENNLDFFSESSAENPLLIEVNNKINELTNKKLLVESKLKLLKSMLNQS